MSDLQTISITVGILTACITVIIGVLSFMKSNRRAEEQRQIEIQTRQAELFMQLYSRWSSTDMAQAYVFSRYQVTDEEIDQLIDEMLHPPMRTERLVEVFKQYHVLNNFFEGLGMLVKERLIDVKIVKDLLKQRIIYFWERTEPFYQRTRKGLEDQEMFGYFEYLYHQVKSME